MALADSVPGVSGGTIAFVMGFYDQFIESLHNIVSRDKNKRNKALQFLFKLGIGWGIGLILSILFIASIFESHIYEISSVFIGLIIGAIPLIIKEELNTLKTSLPSIIFSLLGVALVFLITYYNPIVQGNEGFIDGLDSITLPLLGFVLIAGMIAISAMVLPGISGSTILLIFGLYGPIILAIKELLHFNFDYFFVVAVFGIGILLGIIITIRLVQKALKNHRIQTMYTILGLMIGSLYAVVMGPLTLESPMPALSFNNFHILYFIVGIGIIIGLEQMKHILLKKKTQDN
jgi:putative membrane protein